MKHSYISTAAGLFSSICLLAIPALAGDATEWAGTLFEPAPKVAEPQLFAYCARMGGYPSFEAQAAAMRRQAPSYPMQPSTLNGYSTVTLPPVTTSVGTSPSVTRSNLASPQILADQKALKNLGYYKGDADGQSGPATEAAILKFRRANGLGEGLTLDARSRQTLEARAIAARYGAPSSNFTTASTTLRATPTTSAKPAAQPASLRTDQQALADLGFYKGEVDGLSGPGTRAAIRNFKQKYGLAPVNATLDGNARTVLYNTRASLTSR